MRKFKAIILAGLLLALAPPAFAAVGVKVDGVLRCTATDLGFNDIGTALSCDGSTATFNLMLAGTGTSGSVSMTTALFDVLPGYSLVRKTISSDANFNNGLLANGTPGQLLTIQIVGVEGSGIFILRPTTKTGFTSLRFDAVGDIATLLYVDDTVGWIIQSSTNVTIV